MGGRFGGAPRRASGPDDPSDLAEEILEIPFRHHLAAAERLTRMRVDMIWLGEDIGRQNGMLMSPRHRRRFPAPRMAELIASQKAELIVSRMAELIVSRMAELIVSRMAELIASPKAINRRLKVAHDTDGRVHDVVGAR